MIIALQVEIIMRRIVIEFNVVDVVLVVIKVKVVEIVHEWLT